MAKHRGTPSGLRAIGRQRTAKEIERERELRNLQEEAAKRRHEEAAAKKLCRTEKISSMKKCQPPSAEACEQLPATPPRVIETSPSTETTPPRRRGVKTAASKMTAKHPPAKRSLRAQSGAQPSRSKSMKKPEAGSAPRPVTPLGLAVEAFLLDRQVRQCTESTIRNYRHELTAFVGWLEEHGVVEPLHFNAQHIRLFLHETDSRNVSIWTLHSYARVIRAFCNFLVNEEIIERSPMAKVGMPRLPKEVLPAFTVDEVHLLLNAAEQGTQPLRDTAVILTLLDTGCRAAEFLALIVGDLDLDTGQVTVRQGKGRKDRVTYLGVRARQAVRQYLKQRRRPQSGTPVWLTDDKAPLTKTGLRMLLIRLAKRAGLTDVHPHKFRRTFALWSLRAGMNIYSLQMIMGHSSLGILQRYLALVEADLEKQHREHGAVDSML